MTWALTERGGVCFFVFDDFAYVIMKAGGEPLGKYSIDSYAVTSVKLQRTFEEIKLNLHPFDNYVRTILWRKFDITYATVIGTHLNETNDF